MKSEKSLDEILAELTDECFVIHKAELYPAFVVNLLIAALQLCRRQRDEWTSFAHDQAIRTMGKLEIQKYLWKEDQELAHLLMDDSPKAKCICGEINARNCPVHQGTTQPTKRDEE